MRDRGLAPQANPAVAPLGHSVPRAGVSYDPSPPHPWSEKTPNLRWGRQTQGASSPASLAQAQLLSGLSTAWPGGKQRPAQQPGRRSAKQGLDLPGSPMGGPGGGWGVPTCPHTPCPENRPLQPVSDLRRSHWAGPPHEAGTFHFPRMPPGRLHTYQDKPSC